MLLEALLQIGGIVVGTLTPLVKNRNAKKAPITILAARDNMPTIIALAGALDAECAI